MRAIFKYKVMYGGNEIEMPEGAEILSVQTQENIGCMWVSVDTSKPKVMRDFIVIGTGHPFDPTDLKFIGTYQLPPLVWHLFEVLK